jgi:putative tricarboxylic transport membrane protein
MAVTGKLLRSCSAGVLAATLCAGHSGLLAEQGWSPERNVEIVAGSAAGGAQDRTARTMQRVWKDFGIVNVPVSVVNKPGGGGAVSLVYLNQHAGDGHYLAVGSPTLMTNHIAGSSPLNYTDFTSLALLFSEYIVIAARADSPITTGSHLVARLKKDPGSVSAAVATARGGMQHVAVGLLAQAAGVDVRKVKIVVFNSGGESITSVLGGHVDIVATAAANAAAQMQAGAMRILGVAAPQRLDGAFAAVPTWREQGYDVVASNWRSVWGPKGLSAAQIAYWDGALRKLAQSDAWSEDMKKNHWVSHYLDSKESRRYFDAQYASLRSVLLDLLAK